MPLRKKCKIVIVLSGESGCGKTSVRNYIKALWNENTGNFFTYYRDFPRCKLRFGYEYTTRPPRPDEIGKTPEECGYKFVSEEVLRQKAGSSKPIRKYHVLGEDGKPADWLYAFIPEDEMFEDVNSDDVEVCICCSNLDAYLLMRDSVELETNFHINDIHMVVPYEVLLYRGISRELEKAPEKQNIQEVLRRFSLESNPGIRTEGFNTNIFTATRYWLGPSNHVQVINTNVVRIDTNIHDDDIHANTDVVVHEIAKIVNQYRLF